MLELVFFSTNRVKLSHFRHIAKNLEISIKGFHEKTYYASYNEPRITNRKELLHLSYLSALKQWRSVYPEDNGYTTFFFEDTSVCIDSLSSKEEVPGVDIKYWMKGMTFSKLDKILKKNKNNRIASVRSDIVMHLPEVWKNLLKIDSDYISVHGITHGTITSKEFSIQQNLVYPWLDDKTFNKWFIPNGFEKPLSLLSIEAADRVDFRAMAFKGLTNIFEKLRIISKSEFATQKQLSFDGFEDKVSVFLITGASCSGKTTSAQKISEDHKILHIEASDFMYKSFWERHGIKSDVKIGDFAQTALEYEPEIIAKPIADFVKKNSIPSIITGFRSPVEVEIFKHHLEDIKPSHIHLSASETIRLNRALIRNRDGINKEKFKKRDLQEIEMGVFEIPYKFNIKTINNESSIDDLHKNIFNEFYANIKNIKKTDKNIFFRSNSEKLEGLILRTMLDFYKNHTWLTTTEISHHLNKKFNTKKSKNNVSRYFNQEFHPYYEIGIRGNGKIEYYLSCTGYSLAMILESIPKKAMYSNNEKQLNTNATQIYLFE